MGAIKTDHEARPTPELNWLEVLKPQAPLNPKVIKKTGINIILVYF